MISNFETNKSKPNDETIMILTKALQCDANYLFGYKPGQTLKAVSQSTKAFSSNKIRVLENIQSVLNTLSDDELLDLYDYVSFLAWKRENGSKSQSKKNKQSTKCEVLIRLPVCRQYPIRRTCCFQKAENKSSLPACPAAPYVQRWSCCSPLSFSFFEKICLNPLMLVITYFDNKFSKIYYNKFISVFLPNLAARI